MVKNSVIFNHSLIRNVIRVLTKIESLLLVSYPIRQKYHENSSITFLSYQQNS